MPSGPCWRLRGLWASGNEDSGNLGSLGGSKFDQHLEAGRIVFFGMFGALGSGRC